MGKTKRATHVLQQALQEYPEKPTENQCICKANGSRGSNIIEVEKPDGEKTLCLLPAKFRRAIWIRRGSFVIVDTIHEDEANKNAITGQIVRVLLRDDVKYLQSMDGVWPERFREGNAGLVAAMEKLEVREDGVNGWGEECHDGDRWVNDNGDALAQSSLDNDEHCERSRHGSDTDGSSSSDEEDGLPPLERIENRRIVCYSDDSDSEEDG